MKDKGLILTLDVGTSSLKATILDADGKRLSDAHCEYTYETCGDMGVQISAERIWQACLATMRTFGSLRKKVEVVVPSVFCPGLVALDRLGHPLHPAIIHTDRRSIQEAREVRELVGDATFLAIAGNLPYPGGISLTSILWLKRHRPEVYERTYKFGHINTYLVRKLTGKWGIDPTNASFTGLYRTVNGRDWSARIARRVGIALEKLPAVVGCDQVAGRVGRAAADKMGLTSGTAVLMGANDTSCAVLGAGVTEPGQMLNIVGSSEIFVACMDRPHPDAEYYLRQHISSDRWLMLVITTAGFALEWFRSQFCQELSAKQFWQSYLPKVLQSENSTSVRFRAHLAGDRTSFQHKRASLSGLTLATTREECLSAMVRGSMVPMRRAIRKCGEFMKLSNTVAVTGGGSNPALMALKQRMFPQLRFRIVRGGSTQGAAELGRRYLRNR